MNMPPSYNNDKAQLGWRLFFGLLMLLQVVALGVMWRTYDAIGAVREQSALTAYKVNEMVTPELREQKNRIEALERLRFSNLGK